MPFTIAHPAAVLPFRHSRLPLSALVVGSLAPDFEYVMYLSPRSDFSHTAFGLFAFCIPAGLVALWIFHHIWKRPLMAMAGQGHAEHFKPFHFRPLPRLIILGGGILIGSLLHVMWDSFTHDHGWLVQHVDALRQGVPIGKIEPPLYGILHFTSTVIGVGALVYVGFYHRQWTWRAVTHHWPMMAVAGWMTIGGGVALGMLVAGDVSTAEGLLRWLGCAMVVAGLILASVITFFSLLWHLHHRHPGSVL
jgi:hypothetical protein